MTIVVVPCAQKGFEWKLEVEPLRQDAVFWHGVWRSDGHPNKGELHNFMVRIRNGYHYAVRRARKRAELIPAQKLFEASENGDVNLLAEMKRVKGGTKGFNELPENVASANGKDEVCEKLREEHDTKRLH